MVALNRITDFLDNPNIYSFWQYPFVRQKIRPFVQRNLVVPGRRVLDVGCGPGTNAALFRECRYVGIDLNPKYVEYAQQRFAGQFICSDAVDFDYEPLGKFDLIFLNSLMHHLSDQGCRNLLTKLKSCLASEGTLAILDLVLDNTSPVAYALAKADRGDFARPEDEWRDLLDSTVGPHLFQRYDISVGPLPLWRMFMAEVYP